jgi:light-regulated signal transduction histidine kinase (bacteriophytochrome)
MDDLEGFCYSVSHDLRTPMRAISGNSRILLEDYSDSLDDRAQNYLFRLDAAASRMGQLIDDLLTFSRLGRTVLVRQAIDVTALSEAAATACRFQNPEDDIRIEIQPEMSASADGLMLGIVLQNLIENAIKYSSKTQGALIQIGCMELDGEHVFFVRDNGIGFDMQYVDRIFQPFERLHREVDYPGTGIGLANVRRIVTRHHGRVWASSQPGEGASFYFTVGESAPSEEAPPSQAAPPYLS